jgi:hypothetical protein
MPASRFAAWAGTAESRVTKVTKVTNTLNPRASAALEVGAEVTRSAEWKVTGVTWLSPSATELTPVTQHSMAELPRKPIDERGSNPSNPSNPKKEEFLTSPNAAAELAWWRDLFEKRVAIREIYRRHPRGIAEGLAFSDLVLEWHLRYGARPDPGRCSGCGDEMAPGAGLILCDGARVHLDGDRGVNCVTAYGQKWRGAAVVALRTLRIDPPQGFTLL